MDEPEQLPVLDYKTPDKPKPLLELLTPPDPRFARGVLGFAAFIAIIVLVSYAASFSLTLRAIFILACIALAITLRALEKWWRR